MGCRGAQSHTKTHHTPSVTIGCILSDTLMSLKDTVCGRCTNTVHDQFDCLISASPSADLALTRYDDVSLPGRHEDDGFKERSYVYWMRICARLAGLVFKAWKIALFYSSIGARGRGLVITVSPFIGTKRFQLILCSPAIRYVAMPSSSPISRFSCDHFLRYLVSACSLFLLAY